MGLQWDALWLHQYNPLEYYPYSVSSLPWCWTGAIGGEMMKWCAGEQSNGWLCLMCTSWIKSGCKIEISKNNIK